MTDPSEYLVELRGISKRYGEVAALNPLDLQIRCGEFFTLLGPSGSGKTTLLNIICGTTVPTHGQVLLNGRDVTNLPARERGIGMVFQNYALFPHMSVRENIAFPLKLRGVPERQITERVERVLEVVGLPDAVMRRPSELSGGQQQRVAIARTLVYEPQLVLMDEPLGALDRKLRQQLQNEIKRLHTELGVTIVYVTHDQDEALGLSDRICLMANAKVEQIDRPIDLYLHPKTLFAAQFLGEINVLFADVAANGQCVRFANMSIPIEPNSLAAHQKAKILIRPERMRILSDSEESEFEINGDVISSMFVGQLAKVGITLENQAVIHVHQLTTGRALLPIGRRVRVGWSRGDVDVLAEV